MTQGREIRAAASGKQTTDGELLLRVNAQPRCKFLARAASLDSTESLALACLSDPDMLTLPFQGRRCGRPHVRGRTLWRGRALGWWLPLQLHDDIRQAPPYGVHRRQKQSIPESHSFIGLSEALMGSCLGCDGMLNNGLPVKRMSPMDTGALQL